MKHTIIAAVLLLVLLTAVVINAIAVRDITDELYGALGLLPESKSHFEREGEAQSLYFCELWRQRRETLAISVNEDELDRIDEAAAELYGAAQSGDFETFCAAKQRLLAFVPTLADGEKPSIRGIL